MKSSKRQKTYHHGSLDHSLVAHALAYVRENGHDGFSVREIARKIGVSSAAAYRHFRNRDDLLREVSREGYAMLARAMSESRTTSSDPYKALLEIGTAYVRFAAAEKHLFNLMFSGLDPQLQTGDGNREADEIPYVHLLKTVQELHPERQEAELVEEADFLWCVAHGIAALQATSTWTKDETAIHSLLSRATRTVLSDEKTVTSQ